MIGNATDAPPRVFGRSFLNAHHGGRLAEFLQITSTIEFGDLGQLRQGLPGVRCQGFVVQEQFQNVQSSRFVGQGDMKGPGHASLNGGINRLGLIGRAQDHDLGTLRRGNAVPHYQKFRLDRVEVLGGFAGVRLEEGVNFVNENNAGLQFVRQGKGGRNQLVGFTDLCI